MDEVKNEILGKLFSGNKQLPTIPELYVRFNQLIEDPMTPNKKIADLLMKDQSMVTKILRLSNSALYGKRQEITNLAMAITFLGIATLKNLILQISLVRVFSFESQKIPEFKINTFWEHSLATAYFSNLLIKKLKIPPNENYYLGGLLHDIGKLVTYQYYPEKFEAIILAQIEKKVPDFVAEEEIMGVDHTDIGVYFGEKWKFKKEILQAIAAHHSTQTGLKLHVGVVRVANMLAKTAGLCFPWDTQLFQLVGDPTWESLANYAPQDMDLENIITEMMEEADNVKESVKTLLEGGN